MIIRWFTLFFLAMTATVAVSADERADIDNIVQVFSKILPGETPEVVSPSVLPGMYEVVYGMQVMYMSNDGRYVLQGDIIDLDKRENITEAVRSGQRLKLVKTLDPSTMIVFKPKEKTKYVLTVFTDIDCGYCRKLHRQIDEYLAKGIEVRYLSFPRSGIDTKSYYKAVTVWCSEDKHDALTRSKAGEKLPKKECDNPVKDHMKLAEKFGVSGTPTLILENGDVIPGYVPPDRLAPLLAQAHASL